MGGDAGRLGPSGKSLDGSQVPNLQLPKLVLLAGPRLLPYVGHVGRDVEIGTRSNSSSIRGMGTLAPVLRPGGEAGMLLRVLSSQDWTQRAEDTVHFHLLNK